MDITKTQQQKIIKIEGELLGGKKASVKISVKKNNYVANNCEMLLSNTRNKSQFLELLSKNLILNGQQVLQSQADADTLTAHTALSIARKGRREVRVIADDTDVFLLLPYHWSMRNGRHSVSCRKV